MKQAFTLVELMLVIAIIGIMSTIIAVSYPSYLKRARDTQKKSDLKQYQVALETYANKNNSLYPSFTGITNLSAAALCTTALSLPTCPDDAAYSYRYISDGSGGGSASGLNYVIWGKLENVSSTTYWVSCSNGKNGFLQQAGAPNSASCPI